MTACGATSRSSPPLALPCRCHSLLLHSLSFFCRRLRLGRRRGGKQAAAGGGRDARRRGACGGVMLAAMQLVRGCDGRRRGARRRRHGRPSCAEPGEIEAEFARLGTELVLRKFFSYRSPGPFFFPKSGWGSPDDEVPLPSWVTEEDLKYYTSKFEKTGFTGGLNYYRALNKTWELTSPWTLAKINVPVKFIIGDLNLTYHYPGIQEFLHKGGFKKFVPLLDDDIAVMKDVGHFINEERPNEVSEHIINFINKFS